MYEQEKVLEQWRQPETSIARAYERIAQDSRPGLLTMRNVSSILTVHPVHGDRSSIGRALDCGSSGCGFKPHRSPFLFFFTKLL
jgi:hypothetical protein